MKRFLKRARTRHVAGACGAFLATAASAVCVVALLLWSPLVAILTVGAFGLAGVSLYKRGMSPGPVARPSWIPWAWLALLFVPTHKFAERTPLEAAAGNVSVENAFELAVHFVVAVLTLATWSLRRIEERRPTFGIYPVWAVIAAVSATWSVIPVFSGVRALQLLVPVGLALLTARIWLNDRALGERIAITTIARFIQASAVLAVWGWIVRDWPEGRFAWPGVHPVVASTIVGCALLFLVTGRRVLPSFSPPTYWALLGLFAMSLVVAPTRSVLLALLVPFGIALHRIGTGRRFQHVTFAYTLGAAVLTALHFRHELLDYLARGQDSSAFYSVSGRTTVWEFAIDQLSSLQEWAMGFGYGATRVLVYPEIESAGSAHNAWVELLLGVGVLGAVAAALAVLAVGVRLLELDRAHRSPMTGAFLCVFIYLAVLTLASEGFVLPGFASTMTALLYAASRLQVGGAFLNVATASSPVGAQRGTS